jgi:hypothetical protein
MQKNCKQANCARKGYWIEGGPDGEALFCFRTRHDGENHAVRVSLSEIQEILEPRLGKVGEINLYATAIHENDRAVY